MLRRSSASQLELLALSQCALDALAQRTHALTHAVVDPRFTVLALEVFVREVERGHHGDTVDANHPPAVAYLAHACVEELGRIEQGRTVIVRAGDDIFLLHDAYADPRLVRLRHAPCSRVLSRPIMASTRVRTCSFLCMSAARSPASDS